MSRTKKVLSVVTVVWLCLLLAVFTYTWVLRSWTPSINQDDLKISPAGSLVITLEDDTSYNEVSLNDITGVSSFVFQQVSSIDGQNFLRLDFSPTINDEPAVYQHLDGEAAKDRIVEVDFAIQLDDSLTTSKYVFLHPDCFISDSIDDLDVAGAIRMALQYEVTDDEGNTEQVVHILGNTDLTDEADLTTNAVRKDAGGKTEGAAGTTGQQEMYGFGYFHGGRGDGSFNEDDPTDPENYNFTVDEERCLFEIQPGETKWITLRIWLEGTDENCVNRIAGQTFDMKLKFDSVEAE